MEFPINIQQFLPHRAPMLMVDSIIKLDNEVIETIFVIKPDNIFVEQGVFNSTGIVENAAQTCSGIVSWSHFEDNKHQKNYKVDGFISKIDRVKIENFPPVGSSILTKGKLISMHGIGDIYNCKMECQTLLNDKRIAESIFTLIIKP